MKPQHYLNNHSSSKTGFTIVELLIVIVVIGILVAITVVAYNGMRSRAIEADKQAKFDAIVKGIQNYNTVNGTYPSSLQNLAGAQKLGMTLANTEPAGYNTSQHGGVRGIDGGYNAVAGETGFIYLPETSAGAACNESPVICGRGRLAYWSNVKNQEVFVTLRNY